MNAKQSTGGTRIMSVSALCSHLPKTCKFHYSTRSKSRSTIGIIKPLTICSKLKTVM